MGCCQSAEEYDSLDQQQQNQWHSVPAVEYGRSRSVPPGPIVPGAASGGGAGGLLPPTPKILTATGIIDSGEPDPDSVPLQTCEGPPSDRLYTPCTELAGDDTASIDASQLNISFGGSARRSHRHTPRGSMDGADPTMGDRSNRSFQFALSPKPGDGRGGPASVRNGLTPKAPPQPAAPTVAPVVQSQPVTRTASGLLQGIDRPAMVPEAVHKVAILYNGPNWTAFSDSSDVFGFTHPVDWSTLNAGRFKTVITVASIHAIAKKNKVTIPPEVASTLTNQLIFDAAVRVVGDDDGTKPVKELNIFKFDTLLEDYQRLGPVDRNCNLIHLMYGSPVFGIAKRDAVCITARCSFDDTLQKHYMCATVTPRMVIFGMMSSPGVPDRKGYQRSTVHTQGYVIRESAEGVELNLMLSAEPGGNIPLWLVDKLRGEQMKMVGIVRKLIVEEIARSAGVVVKK